MIQAGKIPKCKSLIEEFNQVYSAELDFINKKSDIVSTGNDVVYGGIGCR
jgi:hypothetical protein